MVIKAEPVVSEIIYKEVGLNKAEDNIKRFARDTWKLLDNKELFSLQINTIRFENDIKRVKEQLKDKTLTEPKRIALRVQLWELKSWLTESKRQLQNYRNTGDKELSRLQAKFNSVNETINKQQGLLWKLKDWLKTAWWAFLAFFAVDRIIEFWKNLFNVTAQIESVRTAFLQLTWDQEKANALFNEIDRFSARSPFNRLWIQKSAQRLLWFNFTAERTIEILEAVWEWVSAIWWNQEVFDWVVLALWQIQAKGKVSAEELLQLAERGLPVFEILREKLNLTQEQVSNIWNAWITAEEGISALVEWLNEKFWWALEKQTKTLRGRLSNIVDLAQIRLWQLWEALSSNFSDVLGTISDWLNQISEEDIISFWKTVSTIFWSVFWSLIALIDSTFQIIKTAVSGIEDLFVFVANWFQVSQIQLEEAKKSWLNLFETFAIWIKTVWKTFELLLAIITDVATNIPWIFVKVWDNIWQIFENISQNIVASITSWLDAIIAKASSLSKQVWLWGFDIWPIWWPWFVNITNWVTSLWDEFSRTSKVASTFFSDINDEINKLKNKSKDTWGGVFFERFPPPPKELGSWWGSWWSWSSKIKEQARTIEDIEKELSKRREEIAKRNEQIQKDALDRTTEKFKEAWKVVEQTYKEQEGVVKELAKEIEKTTESIDRLEADIQWIDSWLSDDLVSRFLQVSDEIQKIQQSWEGAENLSALQEELELIKQNTTEEARAEAVRVEWLSTAERLIESSQRQREEKQKELDVQKEQLLLLEKRQQEETALLEKTKKLQNDLEQQATKVLWDELTKRLWLIEEYSKTAQGLLSSLWWNTSLTATTTAWQQNTQATGGIVNVWWVTVNATWDGKEISKIVVREINKSVKVANKWNNI